MFFLVFFSALISLNACLSPQVQMSSYLWTLPITYFISYGVLFKYTSKRNQYQISIIIILILQWIRMVLLPIYGVYDGVYANGHNDAENVAVFLCCYECFIITIVLWLLSARERASYKSLFNPIILKGSILVYFILIAIAFVAYFLWGRNLNLFEFGFKSIGDGIERGGDTTDGSQLIIRQIISSGYLYLFFVLINLCNKRYNHLKNRIYLYVSILLAAMMVCVIVGERRSSQIYIAFSCIWLLVRLYPKYKRSIVSLIGATALFVLVFMTIYKQFNAFLYDTYEEAVQEVGIKKGMSANLVDAYFYGINTIRMNIEFARTNVMELYNLVYDFCRSIFGIHYFFKGGLLTSEVYNLHLYEGEQTTGFLISSVGYGYIFFGIVLAPFLTCVNVLVACWLERKMRCSQSVEMTYIWAFIFMRFAYGTFGAIPSLLNSASRILIINGLIISLAYFCSRKHLKDNN